MALKIVQQQATESLAKALHVNCLMICVMGQLFRISTNQIVNCLETLMSILAGIRGCER